MIVFDLQNARVIGHERSEIRIVGKQVKVAVAAPHMGIEGNADFIDGADICDAVIFNQHRGPVDSNPHFPINILGDRRVPAGKKINISRASSCA